MRQFVRSDAIVRSEPRLSGANTSADAAKRGKACFLLFQIEQNFYYSPILFCLVDEKREGLPVLAAPPFSMVSLHYEGRVCPRSDRCLPGILMAAAILPACPAWPMKSPGIILGISCAFLYLLLLPYRGHFRPCGSPNM